jgi:hypothetical protein
LGSIEFLGGKVIISNNIRKLIFKKRVTTQDWGEFNLVKSINIWTHKNKNILKIKVYQSNRKSKIYTQICGSLNWNKASIIWK